MLNKKFIDSVDIEDLEVLTDDGFVSINAIHKTIPYKVFKLVTDKNKTLECADMHILFDEDMNEVYVKDLKVNESKIITTDGVETIIELTEYEKEENMYDLELDNNSNHRYYTNDILSHNTTNLGIRTNTCMRLLPGLKVAAIVPRAEQLKTIADKYKEIENAYRFNYTTSNARSNLFFKEFPHPCGRMSQLRLWYILTNADKIRGNTYDWLDFDEYQDFDNSLETEILATQSRTKIPMLTFGGTSKSVDTALEEKWINSSRGLWRMVCPACKKDNYPTLSHNVMDMIRPNGLCCKYCGRLLNVRDGKWDFESSYNLDIGRWGFHVPQIIVPANTENKSKWLRIYNASQDKNNFKGFCEEYLGEATEQGTKEISVKDLENICTLGDTAAHQRKIFKDGKHMYKFFISGCDWGGSDNNPAEKTKVSYTTHVILGVKSNGNCDIVDMTRYAGMDWDTISQSIAKRHNDFNCYAIACDRGVGEVYINNLRKLLDPLKVITFKYSGPDTKLLSVPKNSAFPNMYILNRTESISSLFEDIRNGIIHAPSWEQSKSALLDLLNLVRVPAETAGGETTFRYSRKPNKSDDFLHAINFAMVLAKVLLGKPLFPDMQQQAIFMNSFTGGKYQGVIRKYGSSYSG